jgi:hypothetical protein
MLNGMRGPAWFQRAGLARLFSKSLAKRGLVAFHGALLPAGQKRDAQPAIENRRVDRQRVRLRSGRILDHEGRFICDCMIHDRSSSGLRLKLHERLTLPRRGVIRLDDTGVAHAMEIAWQRDTLAGARLLGQAWPTKSAR